MPRLNQTSQKLRFKKGTAAQITAAENAYGEEAEALYVTDRKQLWVHNGTEYEEVNKYTGYFYNSSGTQSGNRFNNWADLQDSIGGREVRVQFEQDETIPAGAWTIDYQTWIGNGQNPDGGGVTITFPTGVTLVSALNWRCENGMNIYSTSTAPIYVQTVPHIYSFDRVAVFTDTAEFIKVTCNGLVAIQCANGFGLYNDGASLGNYEVINIDSSAYGTVVVTTESAVAPTIQNNTIRSAVPIVYGWLKQTSEANAGFATQANLDAGSINFSGVPGGDGGALFANAKVVGFIEGQPARVTEANVSDALAGLEERKVAADGMIIADTTVVNTITETTIFTEPIAADALLQGQVIRTRLLGRYSTANASDTFIARLKVGGTVIDTLTSTAANVTDAGLDIEFTFTVRSTGVTGSIWGHASAIFNDESKTVANTAATTIDTTTAEDVTLTIEWDNADASNSVTISQGYTEILG